MTTQIKVYAGSVSSIDWRTQVQILANYVADRKARSCWDKGVKRLALRILENYSEICKFCESNGNPIPECNEETLLNGAADWKAYCYGGSAILYNENIAKALCTPSELKRTEEGRLAPNSRETWMDVQVRACRQAFQLLNHLLHQHPATTAQSQAPTRAQFHADFSRFNWVNRDTCGNPRVWIHFTEFLRADEQVNMAGDIEAAYRTAKRRANSIGFRVYRGLDFGDGFVGRCYSPPRTIDNIYNLLYPSAK